MQELLLHLKIQSFKAYFSATMYKECDECSCLFGFFALSTVLLLFGFLLLSLINGSFVDKWNFFLILLWHVHLQGLRNLNSSFGLVLLQKDTDNPGDSTHGGIQHVAVLGGRVHLLCLSVPDPESPGLVLLYYYYYYYYIIIIILAW